MCLWLVNVKAESNNAYSLLPGAPKPSQSFPDMRYHLESGLDQAAQFEMDNVGYPYPNYTWSFSEKVLPQEMHQDIGWLSVLKIPKVKIEDFGNYTLTMTNSIGSYIAVYDLLPAGMFHIEILMTHFIFFKQTS